MLLGKLLGNLSPTSATKNVLIANEREYNIQEHNFEYIIRASTRGHGTQRISVSDVEQNIFLFRG